MKRHEKTHDIKIQLDLYWDQIYDKQKYDGRKLYVWLTHKEH